MQENWITSAGYSRNVAVFFWLMLVDIALFVSFIVAINKSMDEDPWLVAFMAVGVTACWWLFASLRCRSCGARVAWWVARHAPAGRWLRDLFTLTTCPICGCAGGRPSKRGTAEPEKE
jgi:hypothetical protein